MDEEMNANNKNHKVILSKDLELTLYKMYTS